MSNIGWLQKKISRQSAHTRLDSFWRSSLIRVFFVCYSYMYVFCECQSWQPTFYEQKEKSFRNFRTFTVYFCIRAEIESLSQETEAQEIQIRSTNDKLVEEANTKKKLERILSDAAGALRVALRVSVNLINLKAPPTFCSRRQFKFCRFFRNKE